MVSLFCNSGVVFAIVNLTVPAPHACDVLSGENLELEAVVWFDFDFLVLLMMLALVFGGFCQASLRYYLDC